MSEKIEIRGDLTVTMVHVEPLPNGEYPYLFDQCVLSSYCYSDRPCEVYLKGELFFSNIEDFKA